MSCCSLSSKVKFFGAADGAVYERHERYKNSKKGSIQGLNCHRTDKSMSQTPLRDNKLCHSQAQMEFVHIFSTDLEEKRPLESVEWILSGKESNILLFIVDKNEKQNEAPVNQIHLK